MKFKDEDGLYKPIVPILIIILAVIYVLLCVFVFFPMIDQLNK